MEKAANGGGIDPIQSYTDGNGDESTNTTMDTMVGEHTDVLKAELIALDRKREELIEKLRTELAPSKQTQHIRPTETANHVKHQQNNVDTSHRMFSNDETSADPVNVHHVVIAIRENCSGPYPGLQLDTIRDEKQSTGGEPELRYTLDPRRLSPIKSVKIQYLHAKLDELVQLDANAKNISIGDDDSAHACKRKGVKSLTSTQSTCQLSCDWVCQVMYDLFSLKGILTALTLKRYLFY